MPKIVDHDQYREELVEKSFAVFARHGFTNCTMRILAKEIGVSTGRLYHYFATKEDVFAHVLRRRSAKNARDFEGFTKRPAPRFAKDMFLALRANALAFRQQQCLTLEAERTMPRKAARKTTAQHGIKRMGELLDVEESDLRELVYAALIGAMMLAGEVDDSAYARIGGALDELIALRRKSRVPRKKTR